MMSEVAGGVNGFPLKFEQVKLPEAGAGATPVQESVMADAKPPTVVAEMVVVFVEPRFTVTVLGVALSVKSRPLMTCTDWDCVTAPEVPCTEIGRAHV